MDINQLRYYLEVCSCSSISKAAEKIQMSQQGLSLSIRRLEDELGCDLFYRKSNGIVLTEVGKKVRAEASRIVSIADDIYKLCRGGNDNPGRLSIAISTSMISRIPVEFQRFLLTGSSDLDVHLVEMYSPECARAVSKAEVDYAVLYGDEDVRGLQAIHLDTLQQIILVNKQHPLAVKDELEMRDLNGLPFVLPNAVTYPARLFRQRCAEANVEVFKAYESDIPSQTVEIISNNPLLVTRLCTVDLKGNDMLKVKAIPVKDADFSIPVYLVHKKDRQLNVYDNMFLMLVKSFYHL
ncbi:MAG: LysR family transcriptional regulator [Oscillospiraceae bacterium]|nr:LysR family transcriptional regulator [Oscillospiraceae bacterium]